MTTKLLPSATVMRQIDALLPDHAHKLASNPLGRIWTTAAGVFRVEVRLNGSTFHLIFDPDGDEVVKVRLTQAGIDTVTVAMVLAGAVKGPESPYSVSGRGALVLKSWGGVFRFDNETPEYFAIGDSSKNEPVGLALAILAASVDDARRPS